MDKNRAELICNECGIEISKDFPVCLVCGLPSDLSLTDKHDSSLLANLKDVDLEEVRKRNTVFFGGNEGDIPKLAPPTVEPSAEELREIVERIKKILA